MAKRKDCAKKNLLNLKKKGKGSDDWGVLFSELGLNLVGFDEASTCTFPYGIWVATLFWA